jgi:hypothetical protein
VRVADLQACIGSARAQGWYRGRCVQVELYKQQGRAEKDVDFSVDDMILK